MHRIFSLFASLLLLLLGGCATSVLTAPCGSPNISNRTLPTVYMVVVPYVNPPYATLSDAHSDVTKSINETAGLQVLRMASEASDMHVTLLQGSSTECNIENIYLAFTEKHGRLNRKLLSTVVFYWGEVYQVNNDLLVQSHMRVLWKDSSEQLIDVYAPQPDGAPALKFTGSLPYSTISFPPRLVRVKSQDGAAPDPRRELRAKAAPQDDADDVPLPRRFLVVNRSGKWVEIQSTEDMHSAWISVQDGDSGIKQLLPELSFANAVASYISYGQMPDQDTFKNTRKWLEEFRSNTKEELDAKALIRPIALADAIEGSLYLKTGSRAANREHARQLLGSAALALSTNSAVLNLAAVSEIDSCCSDKETATRINQRLQLARKLDAGNTTIARNLLNWYRLLETKDRALWPEGLEDVRQPAQALAKVLDEK